MGKIYKINIALTEEEYEELIERLECEEYCVVGETDRQQERYEKKIRKMRDKMIYQIKKNLKIDQVKWSNKYGKQVKGIKGIKGIISVYGQYRR